VELLKDVARTDRRRAEEPPRRHLRRIALALGVLVAAPGVLASKCITYNPDLFPDAGVDPDPGAAAGGDDSTAEGGEASTGSGAVASSFSPATPCASPDQAQLLIKDFTFRIECGCAESDGRTCTVPRGTTIVWTFADSEEHNISSVRGSFGTSGERLSGTFSRTLNVPGTYGYGCSIHSSMVGYSIRVM
jgi:plastocyanin